MSSIESLLIGVILWVLHFLQTPEGQAILEQTENEVIAELEAVQTGQPPAQQEPAPSQQPATRTPAAQSTTIPLNPRKISSAVGEQQPMGG